MGIIDIASANFQAQKHGWSEDYRQVMLNYKCLNLTCKTQLIEFNPRLIHLDFLDREGNEVEGSSPKAVFFVCRKCHGRWPYKKEFIVNSSEAKVKETSIRELGTDESFVKNDSDSNIERSIEVSKQWSNTYSILEEKVSKISDSLTLGVGKYSSFKSLCEDILKRSEAISNGELTTYKESVNFTIPPHSNVKIKFHWKLKVFKGTISFFDNLGREIPELQVPYEAESGITLDFEVEPLDLNAD